MKEVHLMPYLWQLLIRVQHLLHPSAPPRRFITMEVTTVATSVVHPQFIP